MPQSSNIKELISETLSETLNIGMTPEMDEILKEIAYQRSEPGKPVYRQEIIREFIQAHPEYKKAKTKRRTVFSS